jgi:hypothetical protein
MADDPIRVTADDGTVYMVRPSQLIDANEPGADNTLQLTADNQIYQRVNSGWYRVLRADQVSWMSDIRPNIGNRRSQPLPFALGRAVGYMP